MITTQCLTNPTLCSFPATHVAPAVRLGGGIFPSVMRNQDLVFIKRFVELLTDPLSVRASKP